jgi:hypothetical protein
MAKKSAKASKAKLVAKFKHPMTVEIIVPSFVPLAAASTLDVQKLSKGSHTIEVGFLEGGCCPKMVRAVIRNGMVTRLDVAPCEDSEQLLPKEMSRDIAAIVAKAKKLAVKNPWKPVPVREFVGNIARLNDSYPPAQERARDASIFAFGTTASFAATGISHFFAGLSAGSPTSKCSPT